jgi:hypothetical protein
VVLERGHAVVGACASGADSADEVAAIRTRRSLSAHFGFHGRLLWCHLRRKFALDDQFETRVSISKELYSILFICLIQSGQNLVFTTNFFSVWGMLANI